MSDILEYHVLPEMPFLEQLVDELEGAFHVITHTDEGSLDYILDRQKYFREKFGPYLDHLISDQAIFHVIPAYDTLQDLLEYNPTPEQIQRACEECLDEHFNIDPCDELVEDYWGVFEKFFEENEVD